MAAQARAEIEPQFGGMMKVNPPVFFTAGGLILVLLAIGAIAPEWFDRVASAAQDRVLGAFSWLYIAAVAIFLLVVIGLSIGRTGDIKLGHDHSEPEFHTLSWFSMLFSAGMGIGLMFFGVAEPLMHYTTPPVGEPATVIAAREAMKITFFHWGLHAWGIYALLGLALAYFSFRHGLPLTLRSSLYPLIGDRVNGPIGHTVDILAILGTLFGVATSLGLGVVQINAGLTYLVGAPDSITLQVVLIVVITAIATLSVVAGLDAGIRRISEFNVLLAGALLLFVFLAGPTAFLLQATVQNTGAYFSDLVYRTFNLYAYEPTGWIGGWTLFYWAWWISWSPFVGMFIARISRGRTVRQFVLGVLFVPAGLTFVWFTVFGDTALYLVLTGAGQPLLDALNVDSSLALFALLEELPLAAISSVIATVLVVTFFVTSSDSASLVIDTIAAGGAEDAPVWQRIFWASLEGAAAAILLIAGGLAALQTAAILSALPLVFVMLVMTVGLWRGLRDDVARRATLTKAAMAQIAAQIPWRQRLTALVTYPDRQEIERFLQETVRPALDTIAAELRGKQVEAHVETEDECVTLHMPMKDADEFQYRVRARAYEPPTFAMRELSERERERHRYFRAEVYLRHGSLDYDVSGLTREQVIADAVAQYERHLHALHVAGT
jgi:choline/glycine/proline betaine transport protein